MIFIVIPVFNRKNFTRACILSLQCQQWKAFKIILVDHGSTDGTADMIVAEFPSVILLKGNESMWWTAATNLGVKKALEISKSDTDFVLTLNNDLEVNPEYLDELLNVYETNKSCIVGSTSIDINDKNKISFIGVFWNKYTAKYKQNGLAQMPYSMLVKNILFVQSDLLPGRGTLIPIYLFKKIGLFDEINFPHYAGDEDFSLRAKNEGLKLLVSTKAIVKSHINETGINVRNSTSFKKFLISFTSIRSANNFKHRYKWAKRHAEFTFLYFVIDVLRLFGSYFRTLTKSHMK